MKKVTLLILGLLISAFSFAGDYHQNTQGHTVIYTITDSNGDPVSGQGPRLAVKRMRDGLYLDFSDGTYKTASTCSTLFQPMTYENTGGFYYRTFSVDNAALVSSDYITIVSNDDSTYGDVSSENITFDSLNNLIRINR